VGALSVLRFIPMACSMTPQSAPSARLSMLRAKNCSIGGSPLWHEVKIKRIIAAARKGERNVTRLRDAAKARACRWHACGSHAVPRSAAGNSAAASGAWLRLPSDRVCEVAPRGMRKLKRPSRSKELRSLTNARDSPPPSAHAYRARVGYEGQPYRRCL
jgi:hypothetical protein